MKPEWATQATNNMQKPMFPFLNYYPLIVNHLIKFNNRIWLGKCFVGSDTVYQVYTNLQLKNGLMYEIPSQQPQKKEQCALHMH